MSTGEIARGVVVVLTLCLGGLVVPGGCGGADEAPDDGTRAIETPVGAGTPVGRLVDQLMGGDVGLHETEARERIFDGLETVLARDGDERVVRSQAFWVEAITSSYFAGERRRARAAPPGELITEQMEVGPFDDGPPLAVDDDPPLAVVDITFRGAAEASHREPRPLLLCIVPETEDPQAYLEDTWLVHDRIRDGWIVAAVAESAAFPVREETWIAGFAFVHIRERFNMDPNRVYLVGEGSSCEAVQKIAATALPDRVAAIALIEPAATITSPCSTLYSCVVVHGDAADATATSYRELDPVRNETIRSSEKARAELVTWLDEHAGRTTPFEYAWESTTTESGAAMPWTGTLWIESVQERGEPVRLSVSYDREANSVVLDAENLGEFIVYMNDDLVDLDAPVSIVVNGQLLLTRKFERQVREIFRTAELYGEYGRVFTASFRCFAPITPAAAESDDDAD